MPMSPLLLTLLCALSSPVGAPLCPRGSVYVIGVPPQYNDTYARCALPCVTDMQCNQTATGFCDGPGDGGGVCATACNTTRGCGATEVCAQRASAAPHGVCMHRFESNRDQFAQKD
jgi:hypothetical protein